MLKKKKKNHRSACTHTHTHTLVFLVNPAPPFLPRFRLMREVGRTGVRGACCPRGVERRCSHVGRPAIDRTEVTRERLRALRFWSRGSGSGWRALAPADNGSPAQGRLQSGPGKSRAISLWRSWNIASPSSLFAPVSDLPSLLLLSSSPILQTHLRNPFN